MTYLAPRHGLFAIIMLISFLCHIVFMLVSTQNQLVSLNEQTAERVLNQLSEEVKLPLNSQDQVSLGVLTGRYVTENNVARLAVSDADGVMLVQTGQAQLTQGKIMERPVVLGESHIGKVSLTLKRVSNGEILASQWLFVVGSLLAHLLVWLLYGYLARPTKTQLAALSRDIQDYLIQQEVIQNRRERVDKNGILEPEQSQSIVDKLASRSVARGAVASHNDPTNLNKPYEQTNLADLTMADNHAESISTADSTSNSPFNLHQALNQYVQSRQKTSQSPSTYDKPNAQNTIAKQVAKQYDEDTGYDEDFEIDMTTLSDPELGFYHSTSEPPRASSDSIFTNKEVEGTQALNSVTIQICLVDPFNLFEKLSPKPAKAYLTLCQQLINRTLTQLLDLSIFERIQSHQSKPFDKTGAIIEFTADDADHDNQLALAGMLFAKSMMMINEVVCIDSRNLQRFALHMVAGVSTSSDIATVNQLLMNHGEAGMVFGLLPQIGMKQLKTHMELGGIERPMSVAERDCVVLLGLTNERMQQLVKVRQNVLMPK